MPIPVQNFWQKNAVFFSILLMVASLFLPRAFFSMATIAFVVSACFHKHIASQAARTFRQPLLLAVSILFFIPLVSGLWSANTHDWLNLLQVKLPLLLFPLAFAGRWQLSLQQWKIIFTLVLFTALAGTVTSTVGYLMNYEAVHAAYLKAKVISTPFQNDHLRFSVYISIAFLCSVYLVEYGYKKALRHIGIALSIWFAIYLHLLSARTGLICLYLVSLAWLVRLILARKTAGRRTWVIAAILLLPVIAWFAFPTFQNRIRYFNYDHAFAKTGTYLPGSNDGNRVLSLKAGWDILRDHPMGIGAGDIRDSADRWYEVHVPGMVPTDKLYPSSEWLMHGLVGGWIAMLIFTASVFLPLFLRLRYRFFWIMLHLVLLLGLAIDTGLGVQYGVFLYAFFVLAYWKWLHDQPAKADKF